MDLYVCNVTSEPDFSLNELGLLGDCVCVDGVMNW